MILFLLCHLLCPARFCIYLLQPFVFVGRSLRVYCRSRERGLRRASVFLRASAAGGCGSRNSDELQSLSTTFLSRLLFESGRSLRSACIVRCRPSPAEGCGLRVSKETQTFLPNSFLRYSSPPSRPFRAAKRVCKQTRIFLPARRLKSP